MMADTRDISMHFWATQEEYDLIQKNMALSGSTNLSAFLRKMAIDGMVIRLDMPEIQEMLHGILSAGDYIELKTRFDTAYQEQSSRLNQLSVELVRLNRMLSNENKWLVNIRNIRKARKLTPEIAQAMIDHINVYKTGYAQHRLEIIFRFQEERDALETAYHELEGGEAR